MKSRKTFFSILLSLILVLSACTSTQTEENISDNNTEEAAAPPSGIILSITMSTQDLGLLDYLLPLFTEETNIEVKTVAVGLGKAILMIRDGEADVLLAHAKPDELLLL